MSSNKSQAIAQCVLPRDALVPCDFDSLLAMSPIEHSFASFGTRQLDYLKADYIRSLITSALVA